MLLQHEKDHSQTAQTLLEILHTEILAGSDDPNQKGARGRRCFFLEYTTPSLLRGKQLLSNGTAHQELEIPQAIIGEIKLL